VSDGSPFRFLLRVRYGECDAQGIVFNARWADYVDVAVTEYQRAMFGTADAAKLGMDWRLVKQTLEWYSPARYDDVLDIRVRTLRVGATSFAVASEFRRHGDEPVLATAETIYVVIDLAAAKKRPIPDPHRAALERGAPDVVIDHAGVTR
jgi:acyl-CoA thioester hydrolase